MNVQFGKCNFDGSPIDPREIEIAAQILGAYCPGVPRSFQGGNVAMTCRSFHTTEEEQTEVQPHESESGVVIVWDGRLDNRQELLQEFGKPLSKGTTDVAIAADAYERWGTGCFGKLIGDWAMSIWDLRIRAVILAKDFLGTRQLYYSFENGRLTWSSVLDPLVQFAGSSFELEEEYVAGWLSSFPRPDLTPYRSVCAVPPCSFAAFANRGRRLSKYWNFEPAKRIRYHSDAEYEEHFLVVFCESVKRRLRSNAPILAELSGGMDSSAIVCMADEINANEGGTPVDTVSYYDDSEPNWNERPYFTVVEEKRGRIGHHIDVRNQNEWQPFDDDSLPAWTPAFAGGSSEAHRQFRDCLTARGNRVVLRGIGGDEMLGGVPNPLPELADLLVGCRLGPLAHQLKAWALILRRPWFHLFRDTVRLFLPQSLRGRAPESKPPRWLTSHFAERYQSALLGYCSRIKAFCLPPSFQENLFTLDALRRQLVCSVPPTQPPYEYRYPYLDRDLLEFLFAIPREQLVRPGQRRSLMRRALRGVVPDKILDRKRKAFVSRAPALAIRASLARRQGGREVLFLGSLGFVDEDKFVGEMKKTLSGGDVAVVPLLRALILESWLQSLLERRVIASKQPGGEQLLFVFDDRSQLRKLNERRYES